MRERLGIPEPSLSPGDEAVQSPPGSDSEEYPEETMTSMPNPAYGSKVPCRTREGQFKKIPSAEHEARMVTHCETCTHYGCQSLRRGPWGKFIGGSQGSTHFDLTDFPRGKRLNQLTGWNYEDPWH